MRLFTIVQNNNWLSDFGKDGKYFILKMLAFAKILNHEPESFL